MKQIKLHHYKNSVEAEKKRDKKQQRTNQFWWRRKNGVFIISKKMNNFCDSFIHFFTFMVISFYCSLIEKLCNLTDSSIESVKTTNESNKTDFLHCREIDCDLRWNCFCDFKCDRKKYDLCYSSVCPNELEFSSFILIRLFAVFDAFLLPLNLWCSFLFSSIAKLQTKKLMRKLA